MSSKITKTKITKPVSNKPKIAKKIKAAVAQQTADRIVQKAAQIAERKAITKIEKKEPIVKKEEKPSSFLHKLASLPGKAWHWLSEGGWETLLTVGSLLALKAEDNCNKYTSHLAGMDQISSGTVIAKIPISADMFDDVNDRLQRQLSLYTYYSFLNSSIHFKGAQGDLVNGQIGMFVVPDPDLVIATNDSAAIVRLIREYGGRIFKLNEAGSVRIPNVNKTLTVQPGMTDERRSYVQANLYIVAVTDLDFDGPLGEFSIKYDVEMSKAANTGLVSLPSPSLLSSSFRRSNFPGNANDDSTFFTSYASKYHRMQTTFIRSADLHLTSGDFHTDVGGFAQFKPGVYFISLVMNANITCDYSENPTRNWDVGIVGQYLCSDTPAWDQDNDPTTQNDYVYFAQNLYMVNDRGVEYTQSMPAGDLFAIRERPFFIGFSLGTAYGSESVTDNHLYASITSITVRQLQQFPIDDFRFSVDSSVSTGEANSLVPLIEYEKIEKNEKKKAQLYATAQQDPPVSGVPARRASKF